MQGIFLVITLSVLWRTSWPTSSTCCSTRAPAGRADDDRSPSPTSRPSRPRAPSPTSAEVAAPRRASGAGCASSPTARRPPGWSILGFFVLWPSSARGSRRTTPRAQPDLVQPPVGRALVRHHPPRPGRLQPGAGRHPRRHDRRVPGRGGRDPAVRPHRGDRRLPRRRPGREPVGAVQRVPGHPGAAADHHRRLHLPSAGDLLVALVIGLTSWAWGARVLRAQTLSAATPRLRRGGPGHRRVDLADHRLRDPAEPDRGHRLRLRRHGDLRGHVRDHPGLHRHLGDLRVELGRRSCSGRRASRRSRRAPGGGSCRPVWPSPCSARRCR